MTQPEYVQYGPLMVPPAPFRSRNTKLTGFWAHADGEKLDALCDRLFKDVSGGEVVIKAIGDWVMLTWGWIDRVDPLTAPFDGYGGVAEPQVSVWVPVAHCRRDGDGDLVAERFATFVPYLWLDNAMSLATGRELFGYPKAWGWLDFPAEGETGPRRFGLDVFGLDYAPENMAARRFLMEIVEGDEIPGGPGSEISGLFDFAKRLAGQLFEDERREDEQGHKVAYGLRFAKDIWSDLRGHEFPHVFLKQFRAIEDGTKACFQQIAEARYEVQRVKAKPLLREHTLRVVSLDSHPVVQELGLHDQTIHIAYELEMDFDVGRGRVLWDAYA
jgi:hypothetical protein